MLNIIFIDLDGTILDGKEKHYQCYKDIIEQNGKPLDKEKYWHLKREKVSLDVILNMSMYKSNKENFLDEWLDKIEKFKYMRHDKVKPDVEKVLKNFKEEGFKIILVTMRRNKNNLINQLNKLEITEYFDAVYCCGVEMNSKFEMIKNIKFDYALFIGDTEDDIDTAKRLNIKSVAILNGLREKRFLCNADYLFQEIKDIDINILT